MAKEKKRGKKKEKTKKKARKKRKENEIKFPSVSRTPHLI